MNSQKERLWTRRDPKLDLVCILNFRLKNLDFLLAFLKEISCGYYPVKDRTTKEYGCTAWGSNHWPVTEWWFHMDLCLVRVASITSEGQPHTGLRICIFPPNNLCITASQLMQYSMKTGRENKLKNNSQSVIRSQSSWFLVQLYLEGIIVYHLLQLNKSPLIFLQTLWRQSSVLSQGEKVLTSREHKYKFSCVLIKFKLT